MLEPTRNYAPPILAILLVAALFFPAELTGQSEQRTRSRQTTEQDIETIKIDTDLVIVDLVVTTPAGEIVKGLNKNEFTLFENGVEQPIAFFAEENRLGLARPLAIVLAVDVSGSMRPDEIARLTGAVRSFIKGLSSRPASFALISFGIKVKVQQRFTNDLKKLDRALARIEREVNGMSTHTYDAVDDAIRLILRSAPRTLNQRLVKRAVVVITDGFPVGDIVSPKVVIERANAAGVSVYTVTLPSYSTALASTTRVPLPTPLDVSGLAEKTGGINVYAGEDNLEALLGVLAEDVTSTYVLAFYPSKENSDGLRSNSIKVRGPAGLIVRQSRTSYKKESRKD